MRIIGINLQTMHGKIQSKEFLRYYGEYLVFVLQPNTDGVFSRSLMDDAAIDLVSLDSYRAVLIVPCLLRLEVWLAEMLPIAQEVVVCLLQVHLGIGKSKTVTSLRISGKSFLMSLDLALL